MSDIETGTPDAGSAGPDIETEATGETVGEAKWTALRELERRFSRLDKSGVEFVVLSEGERGLLGVGFVPARVIARLTGHPPTTLPALPPADDEPASPAAAQLRELAERVLVALGVDATVSIREEDASLVATFHGNELGLVIGKHGQTIDAIQYLANAVLSRAAEERMEVVVDAAGYRERRRATLESIADRAAARVVSTGRPAALDPMTAAERKIVHVRLKDIGEVVTSSEGAEPNRHVIVHPA
jgi:spoIIIJ-associated protein